LLESRSRLAPATSPHAHSFVLGTAIMSNNATLEFWVRFPNKRNQGKKPWSKAF